MRLQIHRQIQKEMIEKGFDNPAFSSEYDWGKDTIDSRHMTSEEFAAMLTLVEAREAAKKDIENRRLIRAIKSIQEMEKGGDQKSISNLQTMEEALIIAISKLPQHWVFIENAMSGILLPYFVKSIKYHPPYSRGEDYYPAHLELRAEAFAPYTTSSVNLHLHKADVKGGKTVGELMGDVGWIPETEELVAEHQKHVDFYNKYSGKKGKQFLGIGQCLSKGDRWDSTTIDLDKSGFPSKVVMDNDELKENKSGNSSVISCTMWGAKTLASTDDEDEENDVQTIRLPVHPYVCAFVLPVHQYAIVHVGNLEEYQYDNDLAGKLVLSKDKRELVDLLIGAEQDVHSDIVEGKGKGTILLTSGPPGTGKTLTAEVFSEKVERPLYIVQCSQLGTKPDNLEKHLAEVLERATRWNAILLIDEADVYIHERGNNVQQNAIVGVFLRLLEYYNGVLFLTTNRATIVDDAILSRTMAHIRYNLPDYDEKAKLWKILSTQYGVKLSAEVIAELVKEPILNAISGRSIKQLCRLSNALAKKRNVPVDAALVVWVSQFQDIETREKDNDE